MLLEMTEDIARLREYVNDGSEAAFTKVVERHLNLVYSAALRQVHSHELAQEVAQTVFADLARDASRLREDTILPAWLYQVTRARAIDVVRRESRRQNRERQAMEANAMMQSEPGWQEIAPLLEEGMATLPAPDRAAILLRFFENQSLRDVGAELGYSENAAQKRITRAVEQLRAFFSARGVKITSAALTAGLAQNAVQAAPALLSGAIAANAMAATAMASTTVASTILMTTMQKAAAALALAAAVGTGLYGTYQSSTLRSELNAVTAKAAPLLDENERLRSALEAVTAREAAAVAENDQLKRDRAELARLRGEVQTLRKDSQALARKEADEARLAQDATQAAMRSWMTRMNTLRESFKARPEQAIPEFELLKEDDWLDASRGELNSETDVRKAMSSLRHTGEAKVAALMQPALKKFMEKNSDQFPATIQQLAAFFENPMNPAILNRYKIIPASEIKSLGLGGDLVITQTGPVDPDYDGIIGIGPFGFGTASRPGNVNH